MNDITIQNNIVCTPGDRDLSQSTKAAPDRNLNTEKTVPGLRARYASEIEKALALQDTELQALLEVKIEIEQNRLDTPENILAAAQNILTLGI